MSEFDTEIGGTGDGDHGEALRALDQIDRQLGQRAEAGAAAEAGASQLCEQYRRLKPLLNTALKLVQAIPIYGAKIAGAIRFLMSVADTVCP